MTKKITLATIAAMLTEQGKEIKDLTESVSHVVKHMATKDDVAALDSKLTSRIDKLDVSIHRELATINEQLQNVSGFGKEIDHALDRAAAIEKHLGISKKIAA